VFLLLCCRKFAACNAVPDEEGPEPAAAVDLTNDELMELIYFGLTVDFIDFSISSNAVGCGGSSSRICWCKGSDDEEQVDELGGVGESNETDDEDVETTELGIDDVDVLAFIFAFVS
jgi:hypothetical protein